MSNTKPHYEITEQAKKRFKVWLVENDLNLTSFAKKCECSRQYITSVINGQRNITTSVHERFKKGGYDLL